jgi:hypothetical protein
VTSNIFQDIQNGIATQLGVSSFVGGLVASCILLMIVALPVFILTLKARSNSLPMFMMFTGFAVFGLEVAIGWLPIWIFVIVALLIALMFGSKFAEKF